jgi:hypothetical protein
MRPLFVALTAAARGTRLLLLGGLAAVLAGCASQTVLLASFNSDPVGSPPAHAQSVGTVSIDAAAPGSVRVVPPLPGTSSNWVQVIHPDPAVPTAVRGEFNAFKGEGTYGLLAAMFIPSRTGVVTLQFEPFGRPVSDYLSFLHLDFMPDNTVRIDDGQTHFGSFPRDQLFTVSVRLDIKASGSTAHMQLFGTGASGSLDYNILPPFQNLSRQVGAVRFWMGFPHVGNFDVDDILVTYSKP